MSFEEFGELGTAALVTRCSHDVETVSWIAAELSGTVIMIPVLFFGGVVLSLRKDVALSLTMLAFVPVILAIVIFIGKKIDGIWEVSDKFVDRQNEIMRERLRGIRVIRAFNSEKREHERVSEATRIMASSFIRGNVAMGAISPAGDLPAERGGGADCVSGRLADGDIHRSDRRRHFCHCPVCVSGLCGRCHRCVCHYQLSPGRSGGKAHRAGASCQGHGRPHRAAGHHPVRGYRL